MTGRKCLSQSEITKRLEYAATDRLRLYTVEAAVSSSPRSGVIADIPN